MVYPNQEIWNLRKAGQTEEAYIRGRALLAESPDDFYLKGAFGWVLYDKIKAIADGARSGDPNTSNVVVKTRDLLREYARLELPRPKLLFSLLLSQTLRLPVVKIEFLPAFLLWAGLDSFRPEDYLAQHNKEVDTVFEPLVEKAARTVAKVVRGSHEERLKEFSLSLLQKAIEESEVQGLNWLQYSKARLLGELGHIEDARALLLPFVREKRSDFWAWHALSKIEEQENPGLALALCAKASLTCNDAKFGLSVFEDIACLAANSQKFDLAKWSVDRAVLIRQENCWRIPESLRLLVESEWYPSALTLEDATHELEVCSRDADRVVYADCPRLEATFLGTFKSKAGKLMIKVGIRETGHSVEIVSPAKGLVGVETSHVGDAVTVGVLRQEYLSTIVELKPRERGEPFDCLDRVYGVVDHQNHDKGLASVYVSEKEYCLLPYTEFNSAREWNSGSPVTIWCTHSKDRLRPYRAGVGSFQETEWIMRVNGRLSVLPEGFGFVENVFVPPRLAQTLEDGSKVSLVAVRKRNKKTDELGWTAVGVEVSSTVLTAYV